MMLDFRRPQKALLGGPQKSCALTEDQCERVRMPSASSAETRDAELKALELRRHPAAC
jgi:hypothetical protein